MNLERDLAPYQAQIEEAARNIDEKGWATGFIAPATQGESGKYSLYIKQTDPETEQEHRIHVVDGLIAEAVTALATKMRIVFAGVNQARNDRFILERNQALARQNQPGLDPEEQGHADQMAEFITALGGKTPKYVLEHGTDEERMTLLELARAVPTPDEDDGNAVGRFHAAAGFVLDLEALYRNRETLPN